MRFSDGQLFKGSDWRAATLVLLGFGAFFLIYSYPSSPATFETVLQGNKQEPPVVSKQSHSDPDSLPTNDNSILIPTYPVRGPLPWRVLNDEIKAAFTLNGTVIVEHAYFFGKTRANPDDPVVYSENFGYRWTKSEIERMIGAVKQASPETYSISAYGPTADGILHATLRKYPVKDLNVLVIGSETPWVECFCITYGAKSVTMVDFNVPVIEDENLIRGMSIEALAKSHEKFDAIFSYSSIEHDGLGRYGDPLHPFGDIERLKRIRNMLSPHGRLYLGIPMANDTLLWNAHRVYGRIRFPILIKGWKLIESVGDFDFDKIDIQGYDQPIHVLELE